MKLKFFHSILFLFIFFLNASIKQITASENHINGEDIVKLQAQSWQLRKKILDLKEQYILDIIDHLNNVVLHCDRANAMLHAQKENAIKAKEYYEQAKVCLNNAQKILQEHEKNSN